MPVNSSSGVRPLPPDLRQRIGKLLLMLTAPQDGERFAAISAIDRALRTAGLDWHGLAGGYGMASAPPPPPPPPPQYEQRARPWRQERPRDESIEVEGEDLIVAIRMLRASRRRLTQAAEHFLDDLIDRAEEYDTVCLTARQAKWLRDLGCKITE